ncbi:hypothetical protein EUAN_08600 [Andreesenia angusta]|uniref:Uncharacterized protein n=1 Tax=Andreesenia angusta TaxID=39480 RepID=A0A1S1V903_9FIRM|nr:hypothetical protein [Andreesenia angusta]OHW63076.1 hypothetical protein EUAN_08600 [Andreesenia angusta]
MIKGFVNISLEKDFTEDLKKSLEELAQNTVCVGIPEEANTKRDDSDITNAQLLYIHTHGIRDSQMRKAMQKDVDTMPYSKAHELYIHEHGSPMYQSPPRPVLVPALDDGKEIIAEEMAEAVKAALDGNNPVIALEKVGVLGENMARAWFRDPQNNWPPNSPLTIERKGSENPLIDSTELRKSIISVIRRGDTHD